MKNALILHGIANNHLGNWFPWLERSLITNNYNVWTPDLPQSDLPNIQHINEFIFPRWQFDQQSIIIGHSSGAIAALGLVSQLSDSVMINTVFLVSGFLQPLPGFAGHRELFLSPLNWGKIKTKAKKFVLFHSDNDPYVSLEQGKKLQKKLHGELHIIHGAGHSNLESNPPYYQFPELLSQIIK